MNFKQRISAHTVGLLTPKDLPDTALTGIREGFDSPSLRQLADAGSDIHLLQLNDLYLQSLAELDIPAPSVKNAVARMARYYARQIVYQQLDAVTGFTFIDNLMKKVDVFYAEIGLHQAYEHFTTIADFNSPQFEPDDAEGLSRTAAVAREQQFLLQALQTWLEGQSVAAGSSEPARQLIG